MIEEKNSLLGYLLCTPEEEKRVFCREMDEKRNIADYTFGDMIVSASNLGEYLQNEQESGTYIPLFLETSYDFLRTFFGVAAANRVNVPVHTIANEESINYILAKIHAKCLIVTKPWLYQKLANIPYVHEHIHTIFTTPEVMEKKALPCRHVDILEIFNRPKSVQQALEHIGKRVAETKRDDPLQIVFTSGTTGEPKGAILSHKNVISCVARAANHLGIHSGYRTLTFLPLSHVMAQNEVFIALMTRALVQIVGRDNLLHGLKIFRPNILVSVPRVYQAIHDGIQRKLRNNSFVRNLLNFTVNVDIQSKKSPSFLKRMVCSLYSQTIGRLITHSVRKNLGQFYLMVTAGAACPEFVYDFFKAIRMPLTNAQGLTEVSGAIMYNNPNETLNGSIGYPLKDVEVKIDTDGEILFKGDPVFSGYLDEPQQTSFTPDGWFKTGDLGQMKMINGKPYIFLLGRKKEILVLSSGLNIPAAQIEERLVRYNNIIHQAMVVGDGKPRLAALIVPNDEYSNNPNLRNEIGKIIRDVNAQMDASEQINHFEILPEPFTVENGMLTPTLKIRRPVVFQKYKDLIGQLYNTSAC